MALLAYLSLITMYIILYLKVMIGGQGFIAGPLTIISPPGIFYELFFSLSFRFYIETVMSHTLYCVGTVMSHTLYCVGTVMSHTLYCVGTVMSHTLYCVGTVMSHTLYCVGTVMFHTLYCVGTVMSHTLYCVGTVMGEMWGLAKKATSIAVRVLNEDGSGTTK